MGLKLKEIQTSQGTASLLLKVSIAMLRLLGSVPSVMDSVFDPADPVKAIWSIVDLGRPATLTPSGTLAVI